MGLNTTEMLFCPMMFTVSWQERLSRQIMQGMAADFGHFRDFSEDIRPYGENNQKKEKDYFLGRGLKTFS
jgi:hypothetical protein